MSPPSSGLKSEQSKKPALSQQQAMFHAGFLLRLRFNPEDGSDMFLRKVG
jgi:hypothetical protein